MFPDGGNCPDGTLMHLNVFRNVWRQSKRKSGEKKRKEKRYDTERCKRGRDALSRWQCTLRCTKTCRERSVAQREGGRDEEIGE